MAGLKLVDGTLVDIGVLLDEDDKIILSPEDLPIERVLSTGAAAASLRTQLDGRQFRLIQATIKFDTLPTTSEDVTLTLKGVSAGSEYDVVLARADPSTGGGTGDVVFLGDENDVFANEDELLLEYTNTDTRTYGARIVVEPAK